MDSHLEKLREVQKEAWNKSSVGWKKWDEVMMTFLSPMTVEIIHMLCFRDDDMVMDAATGTGEPGLTIASMLKREKLQVLTWRKVCVQLLHRMLPSAAFIILKRRAVTSLHLSHSCEDKKMGTLKKLLKIPIL